MFQNEALETIKKLFSQKAPDESIISLLAKHKCHHFCYMLKKENSYNEFIADYVLNQIATKARYQKCAFAVRDSDYPYVFMKGAILSHTLYKNPFIRVSGDVDLLIRREDYDYWKSRLLKNGFIQGYISNQKIVPYTRKELLYYSSSTHQAAPFILATNNNLCPYINVDLNMNIMWGEYNTPIDIDYVLSHRETIDFLGDKISKLSVEMEFVAMCMHHYKDINSIFLLSQKGIQLGLFCEIFDFIHNVELNPQKVLGICEKLNIGKYLFTCLFLTQEIFHDPAIQRYIDLFKNHNDDLLCNSYGLTDEERKIWKISLLERLFHPNLPNYIHEILSEKDLDKIKTNQEFIK